jgi:hypothetical protein
MHNILGSWEKISTSSRVRCCSTLSNIILENRFRISNYETFGWFEDDPKFIVVVGLNLGSMVMEIGC